jgi:primosomal protein N' (replication factor Y)
VSNRTTLFVSVILPVPVHREFTYRLPADLNDYAKKGVRVIVPFGKSKLLTGIITEITETAPTDHQAKYVECILDEFPVVTSQQLHFWRWISEYYMASIGEVMNAALPANFKLASETKIVLHPEFELGSINLTEKEQEVVELLEVRETLDLKELSDILGIKTVQPLIKKLIDKRAVLSQEALNDKYTPKTALFIELQEFLENELNDRISVLEKKKGTEKQVQALLTILQLGNYTKEAFQPVPKKVLLEQGISASSLQTLEKNGIIRIQRYAISRFGEQQGSLKQIQVLSEEQQQALKEIHTLFKTYTSVLLHGVTGSGKTEIYVQLIQEQLDLGKQVLFLLPEIALTTQLIQRLSAYFGEQVGVYHSKFNQNERIEIWNHVLQNDPNKFRIILGARSSVFLPFQELGLVIIDEEHESTFKQYDPAPRYQARDASIVLAHLHKAKVLLGSATPALETYYNATQGKYGLVELNSRFGGLKLPEVLVADVKKERRIRKTDSHFTTFLTDEMREVLNRKEQIILFQNRRGYTPLWNCEICNWTPKCSNCDVSLTYHKHSNSLRCHYCGFTSPPIGTCKSCGSNRLKMLGFGTEKIEDELSLIFPDARVARLDLDTTRSKYSYETILNDFGSGKVDILVGTQMVSKGLDFDNVSLVGILDADMLLNRPDFRAFERSFHLMSQVAGRSGRKGKRGKVIIQTGDPDHWVIEKVIGHDYKGFYSSEVLERKNFFYPPFYKIIELTLKHKDEHLVESASNALANDLKMVFKERVIGPESPLIRRIQNLYLKKIKLKIERDAPDKKVKERLLQLLDAFYGVPSNKSIRVTIDVDPA